MTFEETYLNDNILDALYDMAMETDEATAQVFDILLGDNLAGRKEHIAQHGAEYLDDLDVS